MYSLQLNLELGNVDSNMKKIYDTLNSKKIKSDSLVLLPEMFSCGFDNDNLIEHSKKNSKNIQRASRNIKREKVSDSWNTSRKEEK